MSLLHHSTVFTSSRSLHLKAAYELERAAHSYGTLHCLEPFINDSRGASDWRTAAAAIFNSFAERSQRIFESLCQNIRSIFARVMSDTQTHLFAIITVV